MMIATQNNTATDPLTLEQSETIDSLTVRTWVGQSNSESIRFALDSEYGSVTISSPDDRVSFSFDSVHYGESLDYPADGTIGPVVYVKSTASIYQTDETVDTTITIGSESFPLILLFSGTNDGDESESPFIRYQDSKSRIIRDKFDTLSEVVTLIKYEPREYDPCGTNPYGLNERNNRTIAEKNNPDNESYWTKTPYRARAFVGTRSISEALYYDQDSPFPSAPYEDRSRIAIDPEFDGFDPVVISAKIAIDQLNPDETAYRQTVWTLVRNNEEYHLQNVSRQSYFKGSFLYYFSDLILIQYPGAGSRESYLPWNIVFDAESKPVGYLRSFTTGHVPLVDCSEYGSPYWSLE